MNVTIEPVKFQNPTHMSWWYEIRNERTVRLASRSTKKITVEEHRRWWQTSSTLATRQLFFIRRQEGTFTPQVVGILRLDYRKTWVEVSLALAPPWRKQGIGTQALDLLQKLRRPGLPPYGAVVSGKNLASLILFLKAGYVVQRAGFLQLTQKRTP
jgi:RimJ/RimL family protein N-acetyltransferase